jgi:hypothetical protein
MAELDQESIRSRAYALWERAGSPWGREDEFWYQAVAELRRERDMDGIGDPLNDRTPARPGFATGGEHGVS